MRPNATPKRKLVALRLFIALYAMCFSLMAQQPVITGVDKYVGATNEVITIKGDGFGTNINNIKVTFGAVRAKVLTISNQELTVRAPAAATYDEITVTNVSNNRTAYSPKQFLHAFGAGENPAPFNPANLVEHPTSYLTLSNSGVTDLCLCDLTGNTRLPEIITANTLVSNFSQFTNNSNPANSPPGSISFTGPIQKSVASYFKPAHVKCEDINGDSIPDIIGSQTQASVGGNDGDIVIINGRTNAVTYPPVEKLPGSVLNRIPKQIEIADMDNDGFPDIVFSDQGDGVVTILRNNNNDGTFQQIDIRIEELIKMDALAVGDLDNDGLPDIVAAKFSTNSPVYIVKNTSTPGSISWEVKPPLSASQGLISSIRIGDLNGDLAPEIIVPYFSLSQIVIFENSNTGTISFGTGKVISTPGRPWSVDLGDLNGDGFPEIVATLPEASARALSIISNPGNINSFPMSAPPPIALGHAAQYAKVGDVDGDGKPDIAYAAADNFRVYILRNETCVVPTILPGGPHEVCTDVPLRLSVNERPGGTYTWIKDGGAIGATPKLTVQESSAAGAKYYKLMLEDDDGCEELDSVLITISNGSIDSYDLDVPSPACTGEAVLLSVTASTSGGGTLSYVWTTPSGGTTSGTTINIPNYQPEHAGRYSVDIKIDGCVAGQVSELAEIVYVPDFTINAGGSNIFCDGGSKQLSVAPASSGYTFVWHEASSGSLSISGTTHTVTNEGTYYVVAQHGDCSAPIESQRRLIIEASIPDAAFNIPSTACKGSIINFTNQSATDPQVTPIYEWDFGDGTLSSDVSPSRTFQTASTYTIELKVHYAGGLCPDQTTKNITIQEAPSISIINPDNSYSFCKGDSIRLEVPGAFNSYAWSTAETGSFIYATDSGTYTVNVTTDGCELQAERKVTTFPIPNVIATANPANIQEGQPTQLQVSGIDNYEWSPIETLSDPAVANPIATPLVTTEYKVTGTTAFGCYGESSVLVEVKGDFMVNKLGPRPFFSPGGQDNINAFWQVNEIEKYPVCNVSVYDERGTKVYEAKPYQNDWNGTYNGKELPDGVYYYIIRCEGEEGNPRSGSITLLR